MSDVLFFVHYALVLLFGIMLSASFSGVRPTGKNAAILFVLFTLSGIAQLAFFFFFTEATVWKVYPLIAHLPIVILLCTYYRSRISTALAAVTTAYLCCQPAKWLGLLINVLTSSDIAEEITAILILLIVGTLIIRFVAFSIFEIYNKETRSILIFGIVPMVYYLFDYSMGVYTDFLMGKSHVAVEFLPFLLCIVHVAFCVVYYKEYEKKTDAERKESLIQITVEQQTKEIKAFKRSEQEIRILRHDMKHLLNNIAVCLDAGDIAAAKKMVSGSTHNVEATVVHRYCKNATVNYIISDCAEKCQASRITFNPTVELGDLPVDETLFASILSNALDNATKAQQKLPEEKRSIKLMLKVSDNKLLLSVKNPYEQEPHFVDGMPVSSRKGHGYGTQSIRYMTERLGGNCQFMKENGYFILRVAI